MLSDDNTNQYNMKMLQIIKFGRCSTQFVRLCGIILILCSFLIHTNLAKTCKKKSACSCETDSGHLIDLKPIGKTDGNAAYADVVDPLVTSQAYAWNPCYPFTLNDCNNVAACHEVVSGPITQYIPIGTQDSAEFEYSGDQLTIVYQTVVQNPKQKTVVNLVCDKNSNGDFTALGQDIPNTGVFSFQLKSKYACEQSSLSIGSILCIVFVCILFLYIVFGILIQIFVRKESGKKVIPNHDFWVAVPSYIKGGVMFIVRRGQTKEYEKI